MTERNLDEDLAVCERATPGPWVVPPYDQAEIAHRHLALGTYPLCDFDFNIGVHGTRQVTPFTMGNVPDCEFITTARTALPYWLSKVKALSSELEALTAERDRLREKYKLFEDAEEKRVKSIARAISKQEKFIADAERDGPLLEWVQEEGHSGKFVAHSAYLNGVRLRIMNPTGHDSSWRFSAPGAFSAGESLRHIKAIALRYCIEHPPSLSPQGTEQ